MLKTLTIENYALIENLQVKFSTGLNIITGETGTGKSIILGALGLILGERAKTDMIRQGENRAVVEAIIEVPDEISLDFIDEELNKTMNGELLIRREVNANGRSRCFINDTPISLSILMELGDLLIDLHGQHEHQSLFKIENHLAYLDNYISNSQLNEIIKDNFGLYLTCLRELKKLKIDENLLKDKQELLTFQINDIQKVNPQPNEDVILCEEERILRNAEKLHEILHVLEGMLYEGDGTVIERLSSAEHLLFQQNAVSEKFVQWANECKSARIAIQETYKSINNFISQIDFNPEHLEDIRQRLAVLIQLKKKYGCSMDEVLTFLQTSVQALKKFESHDDMVIRKEGELEELQMSLSSNCLQLSKIRQEKAKDLCEKIIHVLKDLGLSHGIMQIIISQKEKIDGPIKWQGKHYAASDKGMDQVEFLISLNPGENPKPLRTVASGGEISRIMLAIKTVLADTDNIPILVFDEIDTGISGRIAHVVGKNLKNVSEKHQIICITHLPQIASMGDVHFTVEKEVQDGRTRTTIRQLTGKDRVFEIAKLLGGESITETTLQSAMELLQ